MHEYVRTQETIGCIDAMRQLMDIQDTPMVGMFWYDIENDELFGVASELAANNKFFQSSNLGANIKTGSRLHKNIWTKENHRGRDCRFQGEYTSVPRGQVFEFEGNGFKVYTGYWIDEYPQAKQLILEEFELPPDATEFVKDVRWDIGHEWADELL